jgi:serine protease AprX
VPTVSTWAKPTIAIVDSGVDASHPAFGGRVLKQVTITGLTPNSPGDGRGHGTLVAGIAVGAGRSYPGVAPDTKIVSLDVMDDNGMGLTSDVIAACDWILQNKDAYGIRVANFSLHTAVPTSFMYDPLNKAVEKLWFSGVVVVAAAGNYAIDGQPSGVPYAPANDPFVITVGADDIGGSRPRSDDKNSPWSAYGYTYDGFYKPEVVAPGRYMVAAVPPSSTMALARPDRVVAPGYMWMSGTSLAAPVVAGGAAQVLSRHPDWTPDQVKGAFMLTTQPVYDATPDSVGVGQIHITMAWSDTLDPPNPNLALNQFVVPDPAGGYAFDAASWASAAQADASWNSASWNSASWNSASWNSASWNSASWNSASWNSASWNSASWNSASWNSAAALTWVE